MFFILSKVFWVLAAPANLILLLGSLGAVLLFTRFFRLGRGLCVAAAALGVTLGMTPLGGALLAPLENRFQRPAEPVRPPAAIIVLGGGVNPDRSLARDETSVTDGGARLTAALALARRFPQARLVYSGCRADLFGGGPCEADAAGRFFVDMGIDPERIVLERRSRNTHENALFTRDLLGASQSPYENGLILVTSAFHMPRAFGVFEAAGLSVTPWPVGYLTHAGEDLLSRGGLRQSEIAVREWIGLAAYRASGRTSDIFPGPAK